MKRLVSALLMACALVSCPVFAQDDVLGLYFSQTVFTLETASTTIVPGFLYAANVVLTEPTGDVIDGYEVAISCTAADFGIPLTSLSFADANAGDNLNQIVTFMTPKPVLPGGTPLVMVFLSTASTSAETISFAASTPSSVDGAAPAIQYRSGPAVACSLPWDGPVVAWLNTEPVATEEAAWDGVKALFR